MAGRTLTDAKGTFEVTSPRDGTVLRRPTLMDAGAVRSAVSAARAAQPAWAARRPRERADALVALGRVMRDRVDEIVEQLVGETGKPEVEALAEVVVSVELIRHYRSAAPSRLRPRRVAPGWMLWKSARVEREPYGVVGAITPWNYPLILAMDTVTAALVSGNAVVVKPSEFTPLTTMMLPDLCREAGLPDEILQVVTGDGSTGEALVRGGVDKLSFTGSTSVGSRVMATAAETLTPVTLELGGKDPAIVLEDADPERTARGIVFGAFFNAGQTCLSIERAYVVDAVADELTDRIVELTRELRSGTEGSIDIGPIVTEPQRRKIARHLEDAVAKGARVLAGGVPEADDPVVRPTVLVDVDETMDVYREETFGPVLPILRVRDEAEAIERANASEYGLFASVWTGDRRRGLTTARRLRAGGVSINDSLSHYAVGGLPMGGVGRSGFGRRRGLEGLDEMTRTRTVLIDRLGLAREPWWFPYDERGERLTRAVLDWRSLGGLRGLLRAGARLVGR